MQDLPLSQFNSKRTGTFTHIAFRLPPTVPGWKRQPRTELRAALSKMLWPLLAKRRRSETEPFASISASKVTTPCRPRRRACIGYSGGGLLA